MIPYMQAKNRLMTINRMEKEARLLSTKIDAMQRMLDSPTSSIIMMPESNNSGKSKTELNAELADLKDKFKFLLKEIELDRLTLIHEIDNLDNEEHIYYLKMKFVYGLDYKQIAYQEHYSYQSARDKVIAATHYYASKISV